MIKSPKQLIIIGDSGVYGWGDIEGGGWTERLRKQWMQIPEAPIVYSLGIRGDGLENVAKRWKQEWIHRGELRRKTPDALLLSIGLNDAARIGRKDGRPQLSADAFKFGLGRLLREIKDKTKVMMMGLTPVNEKVMPFADCLWYSNKDCYLYERQIEETCLNLDIPFLPIIKEMMSNQYWLSYLGPDGIHLNSKGHKWIFDKAMQWKSLLSLAK